jgi:hypothetical protein
VGSGHPDRQSGDVLTEPEHHADAAATRTDHGRRRSRHDSRPTDKEIDMPLIQTAGLFAAGLLTTSSLFTGATPSTSTDDGPRVPCGAVWSQLPDDLQADLEAVRGLPVGEKAEALRAIRRDALDGDYGARVQRFAERRDERIRAVRRALPAEMKADIHEARRLTGDDRLDAYREIRAGALAGEYGDRVQEVAVKVQERREACRATS